MKRVWLDLDAALMDALLRLTFEQRRELERKLDLAILRARSREEQRRASLLAIRAALGLTPLSSRWGAVPVACTAPADRGVAMPAYFAQLRRENLARSEYWSRVAQRAKQEPREMETSSTRRDRRVSSL